MMVGYIWEAMGHDLHCTYKSGKMDQNTRNDYCGYLCVLGSLTHTQTHIFDRPSPGLISNVTMLNYSALTVHGDADREPTKF
jgi:hypothetical protein